MKPGLRVGILGGGQLARMLVIEGFKMGLEMHVMSLHSTDPAAQVTRFWHEGDVSNIAHVGALFKQVDIVTVESEFMNVDVLSNASQAGQTARSQSQTARNASQTIVEPHPHCLGELSDRLTQKQWLIDHKIPTAEFVGFRDHQDVRDFFSRHKRIVLKKRRFGYDGYGTFIIRSSSDLEKWLNSEHAADVTNFIGEAFVPFRRELAIQFAVNAKLEVLRYPLVEWQAENSRCLWVKGPVRATHKSATQLISRIERALRSWKFHGVIAFELFEVSKQALIVNEVAPRVHNSGHYTLEATAINQFQAHLRAILNLPLPKKPEMWSPGFAMWNLLGDSSGSAQVPQWRLPNDVQVHWYGKSEVRPGRKMGHLTALGSSADAALKKLEKTIKGFQI